MIKINERGAAHWALKLAGLALVAAFVVYIPTQASTSRIGQVNDAFIVIIAVLALNLVFGFAGQISIGHSAFYGIGGFTTAILMKEHGWSPGWTFYVAAAVSFVVGCAVALPALRIKGVYLALVTLGVAILFPTLVKWKRLTWLTNGARGFKSVRYQKLPEWPFLGELKGRDGIAVFNYWLAFIVLVVCYLVCRGIVRSRVGRSLIAIRDNETAAAVMGVNLAATKTLVFGVSAAICAMAGSLSGLKLTTVTVDDRYMTLLGGIVFLLVMIIGGAGTLTGPIVGGLTFVWLDNYTRSAQGSGPLSWLTRKLFGDQSPATLLTAIVLIALMFVAPDGIVGLAKRLSRRVVVIVPRSVAGTAAPPAAGAQMTVATVGAQPE